MGFVTFLLREGSSVVFSILIVVMTMATGFLGINEGEGAGHFGMFLIALIALIYLGIQMALAAFARVGQDKPLLDLFFSLLPLITVVVIVVLSFTGFAALTAFDIYTLILVGLVIALDVVFNTQVVFKMNRLATDMVQMR